MENLFAGVWNDILDGYTSEQLATIYKQMTRNISANQQALVEAVGALSEDLFIHDRQVVYRQLLRVRDGIVFPESGELMHHPV